MIRAALVTVAVAGVVVVAAAATVASDKYVRTDVLITSVPALSPSIADAFLDNGRHGIGSRHEIRGSRLD